jgi:hypothetical protein
MKYSIIFIQQRVKVMRKDAPETLDEYVCIPLYEKQQSMRKQPLLMIMKG